MLTRPRAQVIAQLGTKDAPSGLGEAASEYEREMETTLHDAVACVLAFDARLQDERDANDLAATLQAPPLSQPHFAQASSAAVSRQHCSMRHQQPAKTEGADCVHPLTGNLHLRCMQLNVD